MIKSNLRDKLLFALVFILPIIPVCLIWSWLGPIGFVQMLVMLIASFILYFVFLIIEFFIIVFLWG